MGIALISGASRGIGRATALLLAQEGYTVAVNYHHNINAATEVVNTIVASGGKATALRADISDEAQVMAMFEAIDRMGEPLTALVNNAGIGIHASCEQTTEQQFDTLLNIHLKGTFFLTQALLPLLADGGRILNLSTGLTRFAMPGYAAYAAMKGGVEVLTQYLAKELGPRGIAVNVLAPGAIETDFGGGVVRDNKGVNDFLASQTALGRVGQPDDIGGAIAALLSDDCRWITAQRIEASGGMFI
jgi:NAD(P)-dependent dehydrogenase (short-subunit alcohol dehydrogenase family)